MTTLITPLPERFAVTPRHGMRTVSVERSFDRRPRTGRTRIDLLCMLVGADSARFPYPPRRRRGR